MWDSKPANCYSQRTHNSASQGRWMPCEEAKNSNIKLLNGASGWKVFVDLKISLQFPVHIIQTKKQPLIVVWSNSKKSALLMEVTEPWEENQEEAHEQKKTNTRHCMPTAWKRVGYAMWILLRLVVVVF